MFFCLRERNFLRIKPQRILEMPQELLVKFQKTSPHCRLAKEPDREKPFRRTKQAPKGGEQQPQAAQSTESPLPVRVRRLGPASSSLSSSGIVVPSVGLLGCLTKWRVGATQLPAALTLSLPVRKPIVPLMRALNLPLPGRGGPLLHS